MHSHHSTRSAILAQVRWGTCGERFHDTARISYLLKYLWRVRGESRFPACCSLAPGLKVHDIMPWYAILKHLSRASLTWFDCLLLFSLYTVCFLFPIVSSFFCILKSLPCWFKKVSSWFPVVPSPSHNDCMMGTAPPGPVDGRRGSSHSGVRNPASSQTALGFWCCKGIGDVAYWHTSKKFIWLHSQLWTLCPSPSLPGGGTKLNRFCQHFAVCTVCTDLLK